MRFIAEKATIAIKGNLNEEKTRKIKDILRSASENGVKHLRIYVLSDQRFSELVRSLREILLENASMSVEIRQFNEKQSIIDDDVILIE